MTHAEMSAGILRAYIDRETTPEETRAVSEHLSACSGCRAALENAQAQQGIVGSALDELASEFASENDAQRVWTAFERKRDEARRSPWRWPAVIHWWAAAGGALVVLLLLLALEPVRAWAQELLAIFRVQRFTVLELSPGMGENLENNKMLNQSISHLLSDHVLVTQPPQPEVALTGVGDAEQRAGFGLKLLPGLTPSKLLLESGAAAQFTLNRERMQAILNEADRDDLQIPWSVDGAVVSFRISPGVIARYDQCPNGQKAPPAEQPCVTVMQAPSPVVAAPQGFNLGEIAQVGLEFLGMSAKDAANFTQNVDWTSTLVLPIPTGKMTYKDVAVNGVQGVLLRDARASATARYTLTWVDYGIVYVIQGTGDDAAAVDLAVQLH